MQEQVGIKMDGWMVVLIHIKYSVSVSVSTEVQVLTCTGVVAVEGNGSIAPGYLCILSSHYCCLIMST